MYLYTYYILVNHKHYIVIIIIIIILSNFTPKGCVPRSMKYSISKNITSMAGEEPIVEKAKTVESEQKKLTRLAIAVRF